MIATLDAIESFDAQQIIIYPNSDSGGDAIISEIESRSNYPSITTFRSLPRQEYLAMMHTADVMVGNSSSAIIEAPSFDLPVVDIGPRQEGRERTNETISVPHDRDKIREAVQRCLSDESLQQSVKESESPYDYGGAGKQICQHLASVELGDNLIQKKLTYDL